MTSPDAPDTGPAGPTGPAGGAGDAAPASAFPAGIPTASGSMAVETVERFGRPMRHFEVAVSAEAMALAWANRENGPHGAAVTVTHEVGARGYHGVVWPAKADDTLACALILRPSVSVEEADVTWLVGGLIALEGAERVSDMQLSAWWPDGIVTGDEREHLASVKAEIQLGPGRIKNVVVTLRFDLAKLGLGAARRDELLEAVVGAADDLSARLDEGATAVAASYEARCALVGKRVKVRLRPKGETRGTVRSVDRSARLEIGSPTGMVERVGVDQMMGLSVV